MNSGPIRVSHEWAKLREVIVGIPFYRIPSPLPEERQPGVGDALWRKVKAREGQTMQRAMANEYARCAAQMDGVAELLQTHGVVVHRVPEFAPGEEDYLAAAYSEAIQFFPRDPLLVVDDMVIELCNRDARRRRERAPLHRLLAARRGVGHEQLRTMAFPEPAESEDDPWPYLEGGDCLVLGDEVLVGVRSRGSNRRGVEWLQACLGKTRRVTPVRLADDFAHLDLALGLVRPGLGIICRAAILDELPAALADWQWVEITRDEALVGMAANGLALDRHSYLLPEQAGRVAAELEAHGSRVLRVAFDTVTAFRGGLRCWSHPLVRWD